MGPATKFPLWLMVMSGEHCRVGQAIWILEKLGVPRRSLGEFKTDSIAFTPQKRQRDRIKKEIADLRYCDLHSLRDRLEPAPKRQRRLDDNGVDLVPIASDEPVYRINDMQESDKMRTRPELPSRQPWDVSAPVLEWTELSPEDARAHVMGGGSLLLEGAAGSGKSFFARGCLEELRKSKPCVLLSKTHVAAQNMSAPELVGQTCDGWTRRHVIHGGGFNGGCVWLDEYTTLDAQQFCYLNVLRYGSTQFLVSGDPNQMGAPFSTYRGVPVDVDQIRQSEFFFHLCGGTRCVLTTCMRSDAALYDWYTSLSEGGARAHLDVAQQVREARAAFPVGGTARWNLVVSHQRRKQVNRREMLRLKPADAEFYPIVSAPGMTSEPQDMWLWPGAQVYACCRSVQRGLRNGMLYTVEAVGETTRLVGDITLSKEQTSRWLRPSFAQTFHSSQGLTLYGRVELCDTSSPRFTSRMLLMGLSRSTAATCVQVV